MLWKGEGKVGGVVLFRVHQQLKETCVISGRSSFVPTPADPIDTADLSLAMDGQAIVLRTQAKEDAKRYGKLFKEHVQKFNSHYKVIITGRQLSIGHVVAGFTDIIGIYPYKAGVTKALWFMLSLQHNYNMDDLMKHFEQNPFTPWTDEEYVLVMPTPEPADKLKAKFSLVDGKWK